MALRLKLGAQLFEIVDFAVVGERQLPVGRAHRLVAGLEVDDRQAAMAEADSRRGPDAAAVGAAMGKGVRHGAHPRRVDRLRHVRMEEARYPAHQRVPASPAARSATRSTGPSDRRKASSAGRALPAPPFSSAETRMATARCGPPSKWVRIVSSFTAARLPVTM